MNTATDNIEPDADRVVPNAPEVSDEPQTQSDDGERQRSYPCPACDQAIDLHDPAGVVKHFQAHPSTVPCPACGDTLDMNQGLATWSHMNRPGACSKRRLIHLYTGDESLPPPPRHVAPQLSLATRYINVLLQLAGDRTHEQAHGERTRTTTAMEDDVRPTANSIGPTAWLPTHPRVIVHDLQHHAQLPHCKHTTPLCLKIKSKKLIRQRQRNTSIMSGDGSRSDTRVSNRHNSSLRKIVTLV